MNAQQDVIKNQEQVFIHLSLSSDAAYQWSVENNSFMNMQIVLRAHGEKHSIEDAINQIEVAKSLL